MTTRRWDTPPASGAHKGALVGSAVAGLAVSLFWLQLGRPSWSITRWGLGAGLTVAVLVAVTAPVGTRMRRLGIWAGCAFAVNAAVLTTTAVAAFTRGEQQSGRLALGLLSLVLTLLPVLTPRQDRSGGGTTVELPGRLSGKDSLFCSVELPVQPMTVMTLWLLRPGVGPDGSPAPLELDGLRRHIADRLGALPAFRCRVARVPLGLGHPVYVEDRAFDIAAHVVEHVLQTPGTAEQLDAFYAEQAGRCLDSRRPLWRLVLLHGLADGRQAVVFTVHHCVLDGSALVATLGILLGELESDAVSLPLPRRPPGAARLLGNALAHGWWTPGHLPALVRASRAAAAAVKTETAASPIVPPAGKDAPACPLNRESTGRRTFARTSLAVADLKRVKDAAVVTLNDVALALVAGALRDYLSARGSLPERPLLAWVPVSLEGTDAPARTFGNRISALTTTLATDVADPWERLITIGAVTSRAKHLLSVGDPDLEGEWLDHLPPFVFDLALRRRRRAAAGPDSNVVVSHVRGVRPGALQGAALESFYITGPPNNGGGVTVVLASYLDRIFVGFLCVDAAVPAPGELADGLHRALAELLTIAAARAADGAQVKDLAGRT